MLRQAAGAWILLAVLPYTAAFLTATSLSLRAHVTARPHEAASTVVGVRSRFALTRPGCGLRSSQRNPLVATAAAPDDQAEHAEWEIFRETCEGKWQALWQTFNYIGDVEDETTLRVELLGNGESWGVQPLLSCAESPVTTCFSLKDCPRVGVLFIFVFRTRPHSRDLWASFAGVAGVISACEDVDTVGCLLLRLPRLNLCSQICN